MVLFAGALSWQFSPINCAMLSETGSVLQWGDKLSLTLWLRSIGFHSALCSLCTAVVQRESIKTSQVQYTASSPRSHWFHTHGSAMSECDYKMQSYIYLNLLLSKVLQAPIYPVFLPHAYIVTQSILLFWDHHNPIMKLFMGVGLCPEQGDQLFHVWCQLEPLAPSAEWIMTILLVTCCASVLEGHYWGSKNSQLATASRWSNLADRQGWTRKHWIRRSGWPLSDETLSPSSFLTTFCPCLWRIKILSGHLCHCDIWNTKLYIQ